METFSRLYLNPNVSTVKGCNIIELHRSDSFSVAMVTLCPSGEYPKHFHDNSFEVFIFDEGMGMFEVDGKEEIVGKESVVRVPPKSVHSIKNAMSNQVLRAYVVSSPAHQKEDTHYL